MWYYTLKTWFIPYDGLSVWPLLLLKPEHADDVPLRAHEEVHLREQAFACVVQVALFVFLVLWSGWVWFLVPAIPLPWSWLALYLIPTWRYRAELRAYKVSVREGQSVTSCARYLAAETGVDYDRCLADLQ